MFRRRREKWQPFRPSLISSRSDITPRQVASSSETRAPANSATLRHTFNVEHPANAVAISHDAAFHAVGSSLPEHASEYITASAQPSAPAVHVYENNTRSLRAVVTAHKSSVFGVSLTENGSIGASGDDDGVILVWKGNTGHRTASLGAHRERVSDVDLSRDGKRLVSAGFDSTVRCWDVEAQVAAHCFTGHATKVSAAVMYNDANMVLSSGFDGVLRAWDVRSSRQALAIKASSSFVTDCDAAGNGCVYVSCDESKRLVVWDARTLKALQEFEVGEKLFGCSITSDSARVVACGDNGLVLAWNVYSGYKFPQLQSHSDMSRVQRCAISASGSYVVTGASDCTAALFELQPPSRRGLFAQSGPSETDHVSEISRVFFQFVNGGQPLEPNTVAQAIAADFSLKKVRTLADVYIGHLCVRTLSTDRGSLINTDNDIADESFLYDKLYCELPKLLRSYRSQEVASRILRDAEEAGILSEEDVETVRTGSLFSDLARDSVPDLATVKAQVYQVITARIASMETRVHSLAKHVAGLPMDVTQIGPELERNARRKRYASLVGFGRALVPFVMAVAMASSNDDVDLILNFDVASAVEVASRLVYGRGVGFHLGPSSSSELFWEHEDVIAVRVVQLVLSDAFLQRMDPKDRKELVAGLEEQFVRGLNPLRGEVNRIIAEREADRDFDKSSRQSTPHSAPPLLPSSEQAASDVREAPDIYSTVETCDIEYGDDEEDRLRTAFASSSKSGSLSYLRANKQLCRVLSEQLGDISLTEDDEELVSEALLAEIPSNTSTIDETSFMRAGTVLIRRMKVSGYRGVGTDEE